MTYSFMERFQISSLTPPSMLGSGLAYPCTGLMHAVPAAVRSYVELCRCAWKTLFPCSRCAPPVLNTMHAPLPIVIPES